jgi:hypothetical protein
MTERLRLRLPSLDDAEAIFASYARDADVTRYLRWKAHTTLAHTVAFLHQAVAAVEALTEAHWVIERRDLDGPIGMIGLRFSEHGAELGYVLARRSWHQGYAPEAARAVVDLALAEPAIHRGGRLRRGARRLRPRAREDRHGARGPAPTVGGPSERQRDAARLLVLRAREGVTAPLLGSLRSPI